MLCANFLDHQTSGSIEDFEMFYHIWAWQPSWSCDLKHFYNFLSPLLKKAPYEILL